MTSGAGVSTAGSVAYHSTKRRNKRKNYILDFGIPSSGVEKMDIGLAVTKIAMVAVATASAIVIRVSAEI